MLVRVQRDIFHIIYRSNNELSSCIKTRFWTDHREFAEKQAEVSFKRSDGTGDS